MFKNLDWWGSKGYLGINFSEYFKYIGEEEGLRKFAKFLNIFLIRSDKSEKHRKLNSSDNCTKSLKCCNFEFLIQNYNWLTLNQRLKTN